MSDYISRQAAYDTLTEYYHHTTETQHEALKEALSRVPTNDQTKTTEEKEEAGKWHYTSAYPHWVCCGRCYKRFLPNREWVELYNIPTNFCPNCGARMERNEDGKYEI